AREHMKKQQPISAAVVAIVAGLVLASAGTLLANGQAFFIPAGRGPVELVYFARVKDARTGRPIQKKPYVTIVDPFSGIVIPFRGPVRSVSYCSGGTNSKPPRVHRALSPRSRAMGVVIPRLRSNTSP